MGRVSYKGTKLGARAVMQALDFEPVEELINMFRDPLCPLEEKINIAKTLAPFAHPKLAHVTIRAEDDSTAPADLELARQIVGNPHAAMLARQLMEALNGPGQAPLIIDVARQLTEAGSDPAGEGDG